MFFSLVATAFKQTFHDLRPIWKRGWMVFVACAILLEINHAMMIYVGTMLDPEWGPKVADFVAGIVCSGTYILIIPLYALDVRRQNPETHFWEHSKKHVKQVTIEMLRVVAKVILGIVVGAIPGGALLILFTQYVFPDASDLVRYAGFGIAGIVGLAPTTIWSVQLTFVPLIAQFDEAYLNGKVDALRQSTLMVKGRFWAIFGVSVIFFALSLLETFKYVYPLSSPLFYLLVTVNLFLEVYVYTLFFSVYEMLAPKGE